MYGDTPLTEVVVAVKAWRQVEAIVNRPAGHGARSTYHSVRSRMMTMSTIATTYCAEWTVGRCIRKDVYTGFLV